MDGIETTSKCVQCGAVVYLTDAGMVCKRGHDQAAAVLNSDSEPEPAAVAATPASGAEPEPQGSAGVVPCNLPVLVEGAAVDLQGGDVLICLRVPELAAQSFRAAAADAREDWRTMLQRKFLMACERGWILEAD